MRIALLEDDPSIQDFLSTALHLAGHTVTRATEGTAFLQVLFPDGARPSSPACELAIIDLGLPGGVAGLDVLRVIRRLAAAFPVVVITGAADSEMAQVGHAFPDVPILRKPFSLHALLQVIQQGPPSAPPAAVQERGLLQQPPGCETQGCISHSPPGSEEGR